MNCLLTNIRSRYASVAAAGAIGYTLDFFVAEKKIFGGKTVLVETSWHILSSVFNFKEFEATYSYQRGQNQRIKGTTPKTVTGKEWLGATDEKFHAWPPTAGPLAAMNPLSRQNH
ncbi:ozone-responsive stress related protein [Cinnamomum micranthum f. kanehirae]|uniref:Ozone-responsive stress related protein n=1 Tax=Cinnamomum micranthum f. kanehirae TaxID=337451 RepID=A0A3S3P4K9_9MAGN|nr:ozone-responsive stress related protein [Cinnamomum micranthum f. kanehirae]